MTKKSSAVLEKIGKQRVKGDLNARDTFAWAKDRGKFSSEDLIKAFKITPGRAAAFLATMRSREQIERVGEEAGSSVWSVVGEKSQKSSKTEGDRHAKPFTF